MEKLTNYTEVQTDDGSTTLYSKRYGESCHSTSGARAETNLHYIRGCKLPELTQQQQEVNVLEVGFGTGIGFQETLALTEENGCFLNFISFEIDSDLIIYVLQKLNLEYIKNEDYYQVQSSKYNLMIFYGNARDKIKIIKKHFEAKFNAIYQDAFSPKRNSILWTTEWFKELKKLADTNCIMSTYSSSSSIRKSMLAAGWFVTKGEKFGPKRSSTRANTIGPSDQDITQHLKRSPAIEITDKNYREYKLENSSDKVENEKNKNL